MTASERIREARDISSLPLKAAMHKSASVEDWLGTAMSAAQLAANRIKDVREGSMQARDDLREAREYLAQAQDELAAILHSV
jgi:hypothetical protein